MVKWLSDCIHVLREAIGPRRHGLVDWLPLAVTAFGFLLLWFGGGEMTDFDRVLVGCVLLLLFLLWCSLTYSIRLWRQTHPRVAIIFKPEQPWVSSEAGAISKLETGACVDSPALFFAVQVHNTSETLPLREVRIELVNVEKGKHWNFESCGFENALHLEWMTEEDTEGRHKPRDFPPLGKCMANVVSVDKEHNCVIIKSGRDWRHARRFFETPGVYRLTVAASPIEGARNMIQLRLKWTGQWNETELLCVPDKFDGSTEIA